MAAGQAPRLLSIYAVCSHRWARACGLCRHSASGVSTGSAGSWAIWRMWFLANALVHLTLSPALLIWITGGIGWLKSVSPRRYGEVCLLSIALLVVGLEAFEESRWAGQPAVVTLCAHTVAALGGGPIWTSRSCERSKFHRMPVDLERCPWSRALHRAVTS